MLSAARFTSLLRNNAVLALRPILSGNRQLHSRSIINPKLSRQLQSSFIARQDANHLRRMSTLPTGDQPNESRTDSDAGRKQRAIMSRTESIFDAFERRCQKSESVDRNVYNRAYETFREDIRRLEMEQLFDNHAKENYAILANILMRACGQLMVAVSPEDREVLAAKLWDFVRRIKLPLDITHYNSLVRVLNENQTNYDPAKVLAEINTLNLKPDRTTYHRLIERYCAMGDIEKASELLQIMKDADMAINERIFAALIVGYWKLDAPPTIEEMFELMKSSQITPGARVYTAAILSTARLVDRNREQASIDLKYIYDKLKDEEIEFSPDDTLELVQCLQPHANIKIVSEILKTIEEKGNAPRNVKRSIVTYLKYGEFEKASSLYWALVSTDIRSTYSIPYLKLLCGTPTVSDDLIFGEVKKYIKENHRRDPVEEALYHAARSGRKKLLRDALGFLRGQRQSLRCVYYWPLLARSTSPTETIDIMKNDFDYSGSSDDDLEETLVHWVLPKLDDEHLSKFLDLIATKELPIKSSVIIASLVTRLTFVDNSHRLLKVLSETESFNKLTAAVGQETSNTDDLMQMKRRRFNSVRLIENIMKKTADPKLLHTAFELCQTEEPSSLRNDDLRPLIRPHILKEDFKSALEVFYKVSEKYSKTPCKLELMLYCLRVQDSENLQKIMNVSAKVHGEMNSLFDLAVACIESDKARQARKILTSPGFRVSPKRIYNYCKILAEGESVERLEMFIDLVKHIVGVEMEQLTRILIECYEERQTPERILNHWSKIQDDEIYPSRRVMINIAQFLDKHNIEVPFQRPSLNQP